MYIDNWSVDQLVHKLFHYKISVSIMKYFATEKQRVEDIFLMNFEDFLEWIDLVEEISFFV